MDGWPLTGRFRLVVLVDAALSACDSKLGVRAILQARDELLWTEGRATTIQRMDVAC